MNTAIAAPAPERLKDHRHCDELSDMSRRLWGLNAAIAGIIEGDFQDVAVQGVAQLCLDVCENMDAIYEAFSAEQELRRLEQRQ